MPTSETLQNLFLEAGDLPDMQMYQDGRAGFVEDSDHAFRRYGGLWVGMTKWEATSNASSSFDTVVDIRWLFPTEQAAKSYHLDTLAMKAEGKPENRTAPNAGANCHVYSYPAGGELGQIRGVLNEFDFGPNLRMPWEAEIRRQGEAPGSGPSLDSSIAGMAHDGFIYLFTVGVVAVKLVVLLTEGVAPVDPGTGENRILTLTERIVGRINTMLAGGTEPVSDVPKRKWWQKLQP